MTNLQKIYETIAMLNLSRSTFNKDACQQLPSKLGRRYNPRLAIITGLIDDLCQDLENEIQDGGGELECFYRDLKDET